MSKPDSSPPLSDLLHQINACTVCEEALPHHTPRPIVQSSATARLVIIGQAPGSRVHQSGIPWDDPSGRRLRQWLGISEADFYDSSKVALIPMGFCYPGKGKSGDLPPRKECAPLWHSQLLSHLPEHTITLLIGQYAQKYYLQKSAYKTLTETVKNYREYLPRYLPLPHPSPRNQIWLSKNAWFEKELVPELQTEISKLKFLSSS